MSKAVASVIAVALLVLLGSDVKDHIAVEPPRRLESSTRANLKELGAHSDQHAATQDSSSASSKTMRSNVKADAEDAEARSEKLTGDLTKAAKAEKETRSKAHEPALPSKLLAFCLTVLGATYVWFAVGFSPEHNQQNYVHVCFGLLLLVCLSAMGLQRGCFDAGMHSRLCLEESFQRPHMWVAFFLYWVALPACQLLLGMRATCRSGPPALTYVVYGIFLLAHMALSLWAIYKAEKLEAEIFDCSKGLMKSIPVLLAFTALEHMDTATDAIFVGTAIACEDAGTAEKFQASWAAVPVLGGWLGGAVQELGFGGVAFVAFILAAYLPQLVGMISVYVPLYLTLMAVLLTFFLQVAFSWLSVAAATSVVMAAVLYLLGGWLWDNFVFNSLTAKLSRAWQLASCLSSAG